VEQNKKVKKKTKLMCGAQIKKKSKLGLKTLTVIVSMAVRNRLRSSKKTKRQKNIVNKNKRKYPVQIAKKN
jgi:hypothetical protein